VVKITDKQLRETIVNLNHNSDKMFKIIHEGFVRNDEQHKAQLEESKDLKKELILLRKDTNKIIIMALGILGAALGVSKIVGLFL